MVEQQTRHWNENDGRTSFGRVKSDADDYRYFPEPDLVPIAPSEEWKAAVKAALPALPAARRASLSSVAPGVSDEAIYTVVDLDLDSIVVSVIDKGADPRIAINRTANEIATQIDKAATLDIDAYAKLLTLESGGKLTATQSKTVLSEMLQGGGDPEAIAKAHGFEALDQDDLAKTVADIVAVHPDELGRLKEGDQKLMGFFVGKVMAATQGKADGKAVTALLRQHTS